MRGPRNFDHLEFWPLFEQLGRWDRQVCLCFNRASRKRAVCQIFKTVSWLADGKFWYALMLALLLASRGAAAQAVLHMVATGLSCTFLYKWLKRKTLRPRPYEININIICGTPPLDRFSFPSGHTLHAVGFSTVADSYYPGLVWLLLPFCLLVALSRVILGLHYPSDVIAGATIGALIAGVALSIV